MISMSSIIGLCQCFTFCLLSVYREKGIRYALYVVAPMIWDFRATDSSTVGLSSIYYITIDTCTCIDMK